MRLKAGAHQHPDVIYLGATDLFVLSGSLTFSGGPMQGKLGPVS